MSKYIKFTLLIPLALFIILGSTPLTSRASENNDLEEILVQLKMYLLKLQPKAEVLGVTTKTIFVDGNLSTNCVGNYSINARNCSGSDGTAYRTISEAVKVLTPGTDIAVRAGTYRESVTLPTKILTSESQPVSIKGYENERPVLTGAQTLTGWQLCTAEICENNPNWKNIYYTKVDASVINKVGELILIEKGNNLSIASYPDQPNAYAEDVELFYPVDVKSYTRTDGFTSTYLSEPNGYWDGVDMRYWSHSANNVVIQSQVKSYSDNHIYFIEPLKNGVSKGTLPDGFSLINSLLPEVLDRKGEYVISKKPDVNNKYTVYVWPNNPSNINEIEAIVEKVGILFPINFLTIEGLELTAFAGSDSRSGGIIMPKVGSTFKSVTLNDLLIHNIKGQAGIGVSSVMDVNISDSVIHHTLPETRGILISDSTNAIAENNEIYKVGRTALAFFGVKNGMMLGNYVHDYTGTHGNGYTCYLSCDNVLIKDNIAFDLKGTVQLTLQDGKDITIINNIFDGNDSSERLFGDWGRMTGDVKIINNAFLRSSNNNALSVSKSSDARYIIKNNILDGGSVNISGVNIDASNNIWTGLLWNQAERYGWSLEPGSIIENNLSRLFSKYSNNTYVPANSGPAIDSGTDITAYIPSTLLGENLYEDRKGAKRPLGSGFDIGPFELGTGVYVTSPNSKITPVTESNNNPVIPATVSKSEPVLPEQKKSTIPQNTKLSESDNSGSSGEDRSNNSLNKDKSTVTPTTPSANSRTPIPNSVQNNSQSSKYNFTRPLTIGSKGEDVRNLQRFLNSKGYYVSPSGDGAPGKETTYFGPATRNALIKYQNAHRAQVLTPVGEKTGTGYFGPATMKFLNSQAGATSDTPITNLITMPTSREAIIALIQQLLIRIAELRQEAGR